MNTFKFLLKTVADGTIKHTVEQKSDNYAIAWEAVWKYAEERKLLHGLLSIISTQIIHSPKQTLKAANYTHVKCEHAHHILLNNNTGKQEVFFANKNFAGWGLIYKNTHLEFAHELINA